MLDEIKGGRLGSDAIARVSRTFVNTVGDLFFKWLIWNEILLVVSVFSQINMPETVLIGVAVIYNRCKP